MGGEYSPLFGFRQGAIDYNKQYRGWVYACVSHIANSTAKLPRHLLDEKDKQVNHDYLDLITYSLIEGIVSYLKLTGTAYIWKNTIGGRVRELHILSTNSVNPVWDSNRTKIVSYDYFVNGKNVKFKADEIIRIINFSPLQQYPYITEGYSELQAASIAIDTDYAQSLWNWKEFENGATPGMVLETDKEMSQESIQNLTTQWNNKFQGVNNAKKMAILTGGLKANKASLSPKDMEYIEGKKMTRDEILAIFKVPKAVLGVGEGAGGNMNIRNFQEIFYENAVEPVCMKIADSFNRELFNGIGFFEFYNIIPKDEKTIRADYMAGIYTLNEARSFRGVKPIANGDRTIYEPAEIIEEEEVQEEKIMTKGINTIIRGATPGTDEYMVIKNKKRDRRMTKYELQMMKAVRDIAEQQEKEVLGMIKDEKSIEPIKLNLSKYGGAWILRMGPIYRSLFKDEGDLAMQEVGSRVSFNPGSPSASKKIKDSIKLLSKGIDNTTTIALTKILEDSLSSGLGAEVTKDLIKAQFATLKDSRALTIARTETIRATNLATNEAWVQSGVVTGKQWWTALDERVSDLCASLHGKQIGIEDNFFEKGDTYTTAGQTFNFDYDDTLAPPSHPNCRCTLIPVTK